LTIKKKKPIFSLGVLAEIELKAKELSFDIIMNSLFIVGIIFILSLVVSVIHFGSSCFYDSDEDREKLHVNAPWQWKFAEIWNRFIGFSLGGLSVYYFISIRWNPIFRGESLNLFDFVVLIIIGICLLGWLPYFIKNITEGITAILNRILR
jgi:hypothetical protein